MSEQQAILDAIDGLKVDLHGRLEKRDEEIRKNGRASEAAAKRVDEIGKKWEEYEKRLQEMKDERSAEVAELRAQLKTETDARKAYEEIMEQHKRRNARRTAKHAETSPKHAMRQDLRYRMVNLAAAFLLSDGYKQMARDIRNGGRGQFKRDFKPDEYRADFIHTLDNIGALRDTVREASVWDPLRPAVLRDIMPVIPVTGGVTTYPREVYWHAITATVQAVTLPAGTPTDISVSNASGFRLGTTVYGDEDGTKEGLVNSIDTDQNTVNVTSAAGFTLAAGDQLWSPYFTPTPEGLLKPCAALKFEDIEIKTKTHAELVALSRQSISDIPTVNRQINGRLASQLTVTEEDQLLFGSGVGPDLLGIMNTPGLNLYDWSASGVTSDKELDALRRAKTPIFNSFFAPNAAIVSHNLMEQLELTKGSDQHYVFVQAPLMDTEVPMIWKLRLIETSAMKTNALGQEQALIGDFRMGAAIREREGMQFSASDSHKDFFQRNLIAIRAELRSGIEVYYPQAFTKVTFDAAPT